MSITVCQVLPALDAGGVERGTVEVAQALQTAGHRAIVISAGGRLVPVLEQTGAIHISLPIGRKRVSALSLIPRLRSIWRSYGVDIVHARSRLPAWISYFALRGMSAATRPRFVTTAHGAYRINGYSRIMVKGDVTIAVSEFVRDYLCSHYPDVDQYRIIVIPRGVDRQDYPFGYQPDPTWLQKWRNEVPLRAGDRVLTLPGRLTRRKGHVEFIALVAALVADFSIHGLIVGGTRHARDHFPRSLADLVARHGLGSRITLLGHRDDLREILSISDITFALSREPEAFGRTTIEALSLGRPVVGYDSGGTREILRSVYPAGLVPAGDLGAAISTTRKFLAAAPPVPREHPFRLSTMLEKTLAVYMRLV